MVILVDLPIKERVAKCQLLHQWFPTAQIIPVVEDDPSFEEKDKLISAGVQNISYKPTLDDIEAVIKNALLHPVLPAV